jgi:hypothetical protein
MITGGSARKLEPDEVREGPDLQRIADDSGGRCVVRSFAVARQILRAPDATRQTNSSVRGMTALGVFFEGDPLADDGGFAGLLRMVRARSALLGAPSAPIR